MVAWLHVTTDMLKANWCSEWWRLIKSLVSNSLFYGTKEIQTFTSWVFTDTFRAVEQNIQIYSACINHRSYFRHLTTNSWLRDKGNGNGKMQTHSHVLGLIHAPLFNAYESTAEVHYRGLVSRQHSENSQGDTSERRRLSGFGPCKNRWLGPTHCPEVGSE